MLPSYYEFSFPVKIISGHTALNNLPAELIQSNVQRPLIVSDPGVTKAGLAKIVIDAGADGDIFDRYLVVIGFAEQLHEHIAEHALSFNAAFQ